MPFNCYSSEKETKLLRCRRERHSSTDGHYTPICSMLQNRGRNKIIIYTHILRPDSRAGGKDHEEAKQKFSHDVVIGPLAHTSIGSRQIPRFREG
jgi:hypothetical protein